MVGDVYEYLHNLAYVIFRHAGRIPPPRRQAQSARTQASSPDPSPISRRNAKAAPASTDGPRFRRIPDDCRPIRRWQFPPLFRPHRQDVPKNDGSSRHALELGRGYDGYDLRVDVVMGNRAGQTLSLAMPRVRFQMPTFSSEENFVTLTRTGAIMGTKGNDSLYIIQE